MQKSAEGIVDRGGKKTGRRPEFVRKRQDLKMRKSKEQQEKRFEGVQTEMFGRDGQARPESVSGAPDKVKESVVELQSRLTRQLASTEHLLEEIVSD